jgi:hypothetical protein
MGVKLVRGLVLRTTKPLKFAGKSIPSGARVKVLGPGEKGTVRVNLRDPNYRSLWATRLTSAIGNFKGVERGRPAVTAAAKKAGAKKAGAAGAKKAKASHPSTTEMSSVTDTAAAPGGGVA